MKLHVLAAASGVAICAFLTPVLLTSAFAQGASNTDSSGMPTTHSTPAEAAQTSDLNSGAANNGAATNSQTSTNNATYQAQQQQYQNQLQQNQAQQQQYQNRTAQYDALRSRYAAERAAYHRGVWPDRDVHWVMVERDANLTGERVEILNGNRVGTVIDTAHASNGNVDALLVRLDNDKIVWIDQQDVRFNRADGIVMTDLESSDLHHMADERM
jgi:multidrug efflux pump subunit AcrA (membrane-fusion protein)